MLTALRIRNLRNLVELDCALGPGLNLFCGENGSGKTSVLEAIHYLGLGRSFRSPLSAPVIRYGETALTVFAEAGSAFTLGIEKSRDGQTQIRSSDQGLRSITALASRLPMRLIDPHSHQLLLGPPKLRRQMLDWGVFHVEPHFMGHWQGVQKALKQRNAALAKGWSAQDVLLWDKDIDTHAAAIDQMRQRYLSTFYPVFESIYAALTDKPVHIHYYPGWDTTLGLREQLSRSLHTDQKRGYTHYGPQRTDLKIMTTQAPAAKDFSRGQQKVLICALMLAQGVVLQQQCEKPCLYLIDDMTAELDQSLCQKVLAFLSDIQAQIFITSIDPKIAMDYEGCCQTFRLASGVLQG